MLAQILKYCRENRLLVLDDHPSEGTELPPFPGERFVVAFAVNSGHAAPHGIQALGKGVRHGGMVANNKCGRGRSGGAYVRYVLINRLVAAKT